MTATLGRWAHLQLAIILEVFITNDIYQRLQLSIRFVFFPLQNTLLHCTAWSWTTRNQEKKCDRSSQSHFIALVYFNRVALVVVVVAVFGVFSIWSLVFFPDILSAAELLCACDRIFAFHSTYDYISLSKKRNKNALFLFFVVVLLLLLHSMPSRQLKQSIWVAHAFHHFKFTTLDHSKRRKDHKYWEQIHLEKLHIIYWLCRATILIF